MILKKLNEKWKRDGGVAVLVAIWRRIRKPPVLAHPVTAALVALARLRQGGVVVQLGAFVGKTEFDPLYAACTRDLQKIPGFTLLLVEPVQSHFEELKKNYRQVPGVRFENAAIAERTGKRLFYRLGVKPEDFGFPAWLAQLGSLKSERMGSLWEAYEQDAQLQAFYRKHQVTEEVATLTLHDLMRKHGLAAIDLLVMDVEGYEFEIISTIDFAQTPIRFICYERVLLGEKLLPCENLLRQAGFRLIDFGQDTFGFRAPDSKLLRPWKQWIR